MPRCCTNSENPSNENNGSVEISRRDMVKAVAAGSALLAAGAVFAAEVGAASHTVTLDLSAAKLKISRHIYGQFTEHLGRCVYEGIWVGENSPIPNVRGIRKDIVEALKKIKVPNVRWPGGCFADTYHWKDGIGPKEKRPSIVNVHWGNTTENNHFGTHEFFDFCEQVNTEPYLCCNVGSGTVQEMAEWLEYITMPGKSPMADLRRANGRQDPWAFKYLAVGNENWGCGGNMRAEYYSDEYRRFQTYARHFAGKDIYKVGCGFEDPWNEVLMRLAGKFMNGISVHHYSLETGSWTGSKGSSTNFNEEGWFKLMRQAQDTENIITATKEIMDRFDTEKKVQIIFDEWGAWYDVEPGTETGFLYQQNTLRCAVLAGLSLNIFNRHADRVHMANIAQMANVLQAMYLTKAEKLVLTPTYHVFDMFKGHMDATLIPSVVSGPEFAMNNQYVPHVSVSASKNDAGAITITLVNVHPTKASDVAIDLKGGNASKVTGKILTANAMNTMNTFEAPETLKPADFAETKLAGGKATLRLPAKSVVLLELA